MGTEGTPQIKVTWSQHQPKSLPPRREIYQAVHDFTSLQPATTLPAPKTTGENITLSKNVKNLITLRREGNAQNEIKKDKITQRCSELIQFAKKHPFLTAGFAIALILLFFSIHSLSMSLSNHTSLDVLHAHIVVGGGVAAMGLYYAVYLINMARRAGLKDDLEAKIQKTDEFTQELLEKKNTDKTLFTEKVNTKIKDLEHKTAQVHDEYEEQIKGIKKQYSRFEEARERLHKLNSFMIQLLISKSSQLNPEVKKLVQSQVETVAKAMEEGAHKLGCPTLTEAFPPIPEIEILSAKAILPNIETEAMIANQSKQKAIAKKLSTFANSVVPAMKLSPGAVGLIATGILITALAGVGVYFWLHGYSNIYFFGALSAATLIPMGIYGLSMIYEGYNTHCINTLQKTLDEISEAHEKRLQSLEEEMQRLDEIAKSATSTLEQFRLKLEKFEASERETVSLAIRSLSDVSLKDWNKIVEGAEIMIKFLLGLFPDLNEEELGNQIKEYFKEMENQVNKSKL